MSLLFGAVYKNRGVIERTTHSSFSVIICDRYMVFMTATAENPLSHKYVVKGSKTFIALSHKRG